jgi:hypothetical protein
MVTIRVPALPKGLLSNLMGLAGLATICVMVAFLTDWRWGGLSAGVMAVGMTIVAHLGAPVAAAVEDANVRPIKKAA